MEGNPVADREERRVVVRAHSHVGAELCRCRLVDEALRWIDQAGLPSQDLMIVIEPSGRVPDASSGLFRAHQEE